MGGWVVTDNGNHWTGVNTGLENSTVRSLAINAGGHIFAASDGGGVFRSTDNGDHWTQTGLTNTYVLSLAINSSGHIFAGTFGGLFRSTDNGDNWTRGQYRFGKFNCSFSCHQRWRAYFCWGSGKCLGLGDW